MTLVKHGHFLNINVSELLKEGEVEVFHRSRVGHFLFPREELDFVVPLVVFLLLDDQLDAVGEGDIEVAFLQDEELVVLGCPHSGAADEVFGLEVTILEHYFLLQVADDLNDRLHLLGAVDEVLHPLVLEELMKLRGLLQREKEVEIGLFEVLSQKCLILNYVEQLQYSICLGQVGSLFLIFPL